MNVVGNSQLQPDNSKVKPMVDFPLPITKKQIMSCLRLTGYYRHLINYHNYRHHFIDLLKRGIPMKIKWTEIDVHSFNLLKIEYLLPKVLWSIQWSITALQYSPVTVFVWPSPLLMYVTYYGFDLNGYDWFHVGCVVTTGEVYSSLAPIHTLGFSRLFLLSWV